MSGTKQSYWILSGGIHGIVTPLVAFTLIGLAIATYPQFSWTNNALSDLGVVPGATAQLFNFGLYTSGLFSFNFAIGLYKFLGKKVIGKAGAVIFAFASLSLMGIGIANEDIRPFHYIFSVAFFAFVPIALLVIATYFVVAHKKQMTAFTLLVALFSGAQWAVFFNFRYAQGVAIPELLSAIAGAAWTMTMGWRMLKANSQLESS